MKDNKLAKIITEQIKKSARNSANVSWDTELIYDNIELMINGKKTKCSIGMWVEYTANWTIEEDTYDEPGYAEIDDIDYEITDFSMDELEDGTIFTEEQQEKIFDENREFLYDYIEDDVLEAAEGHGY